MAQEQNELFTWATDTSNEIALHGFKQKWIDWATECSPKQLGGVTYSFLNLKDWQALHETTTEPVIFLNPGEYSDFYQEDEIYGRYGSNSHLYVYKEMKANYDHQEAMVKLGKKIAIKSLPENITAGMVKTNHGLGIDGGMRNRTPNFIWYYLENKFGTIKKANILALKNELEIFWDTKEPIETFLQGLQVTLGHLDYAKQSLSQYDSIEAIKKTLPAAQFENCFINFELKYDTLEKKTVKRFCDAIVKFEKASSSTWTSATLRLNTAAAVINMSAVEFEKRLNEEVEERLARRDGDIEMRVAAAIKADRKIQKRHSSPQSATTNVDEFPFYCWTHGPSMTHNGDKCRDKADDHKDEATSKKKMGGRVEPWSSYKGKKLKA
jgi:hypothetical protein